MKKVNDMSKILAGLVFVALLATACGETATPATTTTAVTSGTTATSGATAKATTGAATTVATTGTVATTAKATTPVAARSAVATTSSATGEASLPAIPGGTAVTLGSAMQSKLSEQFKSMAPGVKDMSVTFYGSADSPDTFANNVDQALIKAGYKFAIPGETKPTKQGDGIVSLYTKPGVPDLFLEFGDPNKGMGFDVNTLQTLNAQFKDKKSLLVFISGTGFINALSKGSETTPVATAGSATQAAITSASSTASGNIGKELVGQVVEVGAVKSTVTGVEQ